MSRHASGDDDGYRGHAAPSLFDDDHATASEPQGWDDDAHPSGPLPVSRASRRHAKARRARVRRRRIGFGLTLVLLVALGVGAWQLSGKLFDFGGAPADYSGQGTGSVTVTIADGASSSQIGQTLADAGVVSSVDAFVQAATDDQRSLGIQPGVYTLREKMSAQSALELLLDPSSKQTRTLVIREGEILPEVLKDLATALDVPQDQVQAAAKQVDQILPPAYLTPKAPSSLEGFLFPATYPFNPGTTPLRALQDIVSTYVANDREAGLSDSAAGLKLTPYQALTIASIAEGEAKFPGDYAKVARVILNRIAIGRPLQIDATTIYGARIKGVEPSTIDYATYASPYNSYLNKGLTPTPINSPGEAVMAETAAPADGNWIYYVNGDAEGHLFFTDSEAEFTAAVDKCRANNWGCA